jgi:hypothetical protein
MTYILDTFLYLLIVFPFFIYIAAYSIEYYRLKYNINDDAYIKYIGGFIFPVNKFFLWIHGKDKPLRHLPTEKILDILIGRKIIYSIFPMLCIFIIIPLGLLQQADLQNSLANFSCWFIIFLSWVLSWRAGNKIRNI